MSNCAHCGKLTAKGSAYCGHCGTATPKTAARLAHLALLRGHLDALNPTDYPSFVLADILQYLIEHSE